MSRPEFPEQPFGFPHSGARSMPGVLSEARRLAAVEALARQAMGGGGGGGGGIPVGGEIIYYGTSEPAGDDWKFPNGQAISRTTYAELFDLIGTTHGAGDGSTTFNLPDKRGRVSVVHHPGDGDFGTLWEKLGAKTHALTTAELAVHSHSNGTLAAASHTHTTFASPILRESRNASTGGNGTFAKPTGTTGASYDPTTGASGELNVTGSTSNAGSGNAHNNIQPSMVVNALIRCR